MKLNTEIIEKYLLNELSQTELKKFEEQLSESQSLREEVELQKKIMQGVEELAIRQEINQSIKRVKFKNLLNKLALATVTLAITAATFYYISKEKEPDKKEQQLHQLNEKGEANWSEADKVLEAQLFKINPKRDTIIETKNGIIFQIKANSFESKAGVAPQNEIEIEIKEALTAADIIKAGLSTTSNGRLLETGGMFYINARNGNESLSINKNKPLQVNVPGTNNKDMSLFEGERTKSGDINWINPQPMRRQLTTVDISKLNFYPPHFLDTLAKMGFDVKNKKVTDSIYYSFSGYNTCSEISYARPVAPMLTGVADSVKRNEKIVLSNNEYNTIAASVNVAVSASYVTSSQTSSPINTKSGPNGGKIFKQNCAVCHYAHSDKLLTGPGLLNVTERVPKGDWLIRYILNNEKLIKSGDAYANKIFKKYAKAAMTVFEGQLSESDVKAVIDYISNYKPVKLSNAQNDCIAEINPSRIKTIWDPKFNGTLLATKEFEERLQTIFSTCNVNLFNLYTQNLNKNLYELDSIAAYVYGGAAKQKFIEFYKRRNGAVDISDEQNVELQKYLTTKRTIFDKAINETMNEFYKKEQELTSEAELKTLEHNNKLSANKTKLLNEEIEANITEAYRQLGKPRPLVYVTSYNLGIPVPNYLNAPVTNTGWHNVDRYAYNSAVTRNTLNYTDSASGKSAVIDYEEIKVKLKNYKDYNKVVCYLLTDRLSSFQLLKDTAGVFTEKLNQSFANSIIMVAYKDGKTFYKEEKYAKAQEYDFNLEEIDTETLTRRINMRYNFIGTENVIRDIDFSLFTHKENVRIAKIEAREKLRKRIFKVVYPCKEYFAENDSASELQ